MTVIKIRCYHLCNLIIAALIEDFCIAGDSVTVNTFTIQLLRLASMSSRSSLYFQYSRQQNVICYLFSEKLHPALIVSTVDDAIGRRYTRPLLRHSAVPRLIQWWRGIWKTRIFVPSYWNDDKQHRMTFKDDLQPSLRITSMDFKRYDKDNLTWFEKKVHI